MGQAFDPPPALPPTPLPAPPAGPVPPVLAPPLGAPPPGAPPILDAPPAGAPPVLDAPPDSAPPTAFAPPLPADEFGEPAVTPIPALDVEPAFAIPEPALPGFPPEADDGSPALLPHARTVAESVIARIHPCREEPKARVNRAGQPPSDQRTGDFTQLVALVRLMGRRIIAPSKY